MLRTSKWTGMYYWRAGNDNELGVEGCDLREGIQVRFFLLLSLLLLNVLLN